MKSPLCLLAAVIALHGISAHGQTSKEPAPVNQGNPFGIASGAEWSKDYPQFEPMLKGAGIGWLRYFPEWHSIQPKQGEWNWERTDAFVAKTRENGIQITAPLCYFAPWASSGNDSRTFPVKDMAYWRDFVAGVVGRYHKDIQYWEMWNEPQSFQKNGTPQIYAEMVKAAYEAGKKADPQAKFGLTSANFAVSYLNMVLKAGATDHFDYLCVHPYENMDQLKRSGGEVGFLSMAGNLRRMLAAHGQRADLPLWITEIGWQAPIKEDAEKEAEQSRLLVKAYTLALAQGFERMFWFEARGPAYGKGTDHGIIRADWTPRPALTAMEVMSTALGESPKYAGWLDWEGSFGFLFECEDGKTLVAWSPQGKSQKVKFLTDVTVLDLLGKELNVAAGEELTLTNVPVFIAGISATLQRTAKGNRGKPFPWGGDFTTAAEVTARWGGEAVSRGIEILGNPAMETVGNESFVRVKKGGGVSFRLNPGFAPFGTTNLELKIVARRLDPKQVAGFQTMSESLKTITGYDRIGYWTIPAGDGWQEHTWKITDANYVGTWAYNLALTEVSGDFLIKEISVKKVVK